MEEHSKLKIGRKEAHNTGDPKQHLDVEKSKVKVIRSQVKTDSVSKQGPQLVAPMAPPGETVYKYRCKVPKIMLMDNGRKYHY